MAIHMFENYGWTTCGTITPTDKKSHSKQDIPFLKLLKGSMKEVQRGWYHEAVLELQTRLSKKYYLQCTTWKDKRQVVFLHSNGIGRTKDNYVRRHSKEKRTRDILTAPNAQKNYANNYNGVDRNDRDSADWSTTIRTTRYYLRIFCWALDRVVHTCYVVVCFLADASIGDPKWKKYGSKHNGRHDFQIDLGLALLNYAIALDWDGSLERPEYMRQKEFVPCDCTKCYFCINGHTKGICPKRDQEYLLEFKCG